MRFCRMIILAALLMLVGSSTAEDLMAETVTIGIHETRLAFTESNEHPLAFMLGTMHAVGYDYFSGGAEEEWDATFVKDPSDLNKVWIYNICSGGCSASYPVYGIVTEDKTEIHIPVGQTTAVTSSYDVILEGFRDEGETDIENGDYIVGKISEDGTITITDWFGAHAYAAGTTNSAGWYAIEMGGKFNATKRTFHVATAGTLPDLISESEKYTIEELTLTGELNGTDFRLLRDMAGCNYLGEHTNGRLEIFDFSGAKIVEGGEKYIDTNYLLEKGDFHYAITNSEDLPSFLFYCCESLRSVSIPNSVTSIGNDAFSGCSGLISITIPNSVTSIGNYAFNGCSDLTSITIPNSVTSIGDLTFLGCTGLTSITVSDGNTKYDSRNNCNAIIETTSNTLITGCKNTVIPNSVTSIGNHAFYECSGLTSITIPYSITTIGKYAFWRCSALTSITIPNSVTSIGNDAFAFCSGLTSLTIPNSVKNIGNSAFSQCSGLTSLTIPNSVTSIGDWAFLGCTGLTSITVSDGNTKYDSRNNCNAIIETSSNTLIIGCKNTVIPNNVTSIGNFAFYECSSLISLTIPNSVTSIGNYAFNGCSGLTSITIPNSVTSIGNNAFENCTGLTSITIPNSVASIGNCAFLWCSGLTDVIINIQSPFEISDNVFSLDTYIKATLTVPDETKSSYLATNYWNKFKSIMEPGIGYNQRVIHVEVAGTLSGLIPESEKYTIEKLILTGELNGTDFRLLRDMAGCNYLGEYTNGRLKILDFSGAKIVAGGEKYIDTNKLSVSYGNYRDTITGNYRYAINKNDELPQHVFQGCSLGSVSISNSVISIGSDAFSYCSGLTSITIPNSVTTIGNYAFLCCGSLTSITIPNSVTSFGDYAFHECSGLTSITISNSVTSIGNYAFYECSGLTSITIPNSVTSIGNDAFAFCSGLTSLTIPNSVKNIGNSAFEGCSGLTSITVSDGNAKYDSRNNCNAIIETSSNTLIMGCKNTAIPNSVTSIGNGAFYRCSGLISITIPYSVTTIGKYAFWRCSGLTTITIPNDVTSIGSSAFSGCTGLTSIAIPNSVTNIGNYAFENCSGLTDVIINIQSPFEISEKVFSLDTYTKATLIIPKGTKSAYQSTNYWNKFSNIVESTSGGDNMESKRTIHVATAGTLSDYIMESEKYSIVELVITGKLNAKDFQLICDMAGRDNKGQPTLGKLRVLDLSAAELVVGGELFVNTDMIQWIKSASFHPFYLNCACLIDNPYTIPECLFGGCTSLVEITLPKSITSIGEYSFIGCTRLSNIHIPDNVNAIGLGAFSDTAWLDNQPEGVVYAGKVVYCYKGDMPQNTSIDLKEGTTGIAGIAFRSCQNLLSINIPNSVITIGDQAFGGCSSLSSLTIPIGLTSIGDRAFANTPWESTLLEKHPDGFVYLGNVVYHYKGEMPPNTSVKLREGTIGIAGGAFNNCNNMTSLTIPSSVISINHRAYSNAFSDCNNLSEISVEPGNNYYMSISGVLFDKNGTKLIYYPRAKTETLYEVPEKVTIIDEMAFKNCGNLTTVILPNSVFAISLFSFYGCNSLTSLRLPDSLISVCQYSFLGCHCIKETVIPNSVKYIGTRSFQSANLSSITLPQYEISIAGNAFEGCSAIKTVISKNTTPSEINKNIFPSATYSNATLFVPSGTKVLYQSTNYWNMFNNIIERDTEIVMGDTNGDGSINVADIVEVVNCIMGKPSEKFLEEAADLTGDGIVNVADIVKLVSLVMGQSNSRQSMATAEAMTNNDQLALTENVDYTLSLLLTNEGSYTASQFDIKLAEGQTLERVELNRQRAADHHLVYTQTGRNTYRVMIYSMSNSFYEGNEGELLKIYASDGRIEVDNILFITNTQQEKHFLPLNNNTTGIDNSKLIIDNSYPVFDLQGRRVTNGQWNKGVYIKKGKKHINR